MNYTKEKARVDVMQAVLFRQLRSPCGISRSSDELSRAFQRAPNWTGRGEPLHSTGRALSAARSRRAGLIVDYRRKFLDSLVRGGEEEAKQAEAHYEQAKRN